MPSPFPGMDPYIEADEWQEFHTSFIVEVRRVIAPLLAPKYLARVERRIYLERIYTEAQRLPDLHITRQKGSQGHRKPAAETGAVATLEPRVLHMPTPEEHRETYLVIRDREHKDIVTVIELLSPTNKRPGSDGYREYSAKRDELLSRDVQLIEIDLLRGGTRPATLEPLQETTDYCAFVHRHGQFPRVEVYEWTIRDPLPVIPIPLAGSDPDAPLNLQAAFNSFYDSAIYELALDYRAELKPPLRRTDAVWARQLVSKWRRQRM